MEGKKGVGIRALDLGLGAVQLCAVQGKVFRAWYLQQTG